MKLKFLPSLREKKRYVFFRINSEKGLRYEEVRNALNSSLLEWLGDRNFSRAGIRIIRNLYDRESGTLVVRCSHRFTDDLKVGASLIHQIGDSKVVFQTLRVSGTIRSGQEKIGKGK